MLLLQDSIEPDVEQFLNVVRRRAAPTRVHHAELFLDEAIKCRVTERYGLADDVDSGDPYALLKRDIALHTFLGYDVFRVSVLKEAFAGSMLQAADSTAAPGQRKAVRSWSDEHGGPIRSWSDFDAYPWPAVADIDFSDLEWLDRHLPENMGCYELTAHILEMVVFLLGYEPFCLQLFDAPDLVEAVFQKVGEFFTAFTRSLCDFACVKVVWGSDDMGFRTSTMVSAQDLKDKVLPWHKRCADIAHERGRPYFLHACGNLEQIMPALIDDVGIDAKHSYEDVIMPVTEAKARYGEQIAILGGIDVDFLCQSDEDAIRRRVHETLTACMRGGGYCLGTGNSVANYIPIDNYLIMLDEGRRFQVGRPERTVQQDREHSSADE